MAETQFDLNTILQSVMQNLSRPAPQLPSYNPPSSAPFTAAVGNVAAGGAAFEETGRAGLQTLRESAASIKENEAKKAEAITSQEQAKLERANLIAQLAKDIANPFGGLANQTNSRISQLAAESTALTDQAREMRKQIDQRANVNLLSDPLTWLENQFVLPGQVAQQNSIAEQARAQRSEIADLIALKTNELNYARQTIPTLSAAEVAGTAQITSAQAKIEAAKADKILAAASTQFAGQMFAKEQAMAGLAGQQLAVAQQEAQRVLQSQVDNIRFAETQETQQIQALSLLSSMEGSLGKTKTHEVVARKTEQMFGMATGSIDATVIARLPADVRAALVAASTGKLGATPFAAIKNTDVFAELGITFNPQDPIHRATLETQERLKGIINASPTGSSQAFTTAKKPTQAMIDMIDKEVRSRVGADFATPETSNQYLSFARIAQPRDFFEPGSDGTAGPKGTFLIGAQLAGLSSATVLQLGTFVAPLLAAKSPVDALTVAQTIMAGAQAKGATLQQQAQLSSDYFRAAVAARNASSRLEAFGINFPNNSSADLINTYNVAAPVSISSFGFKSPALNLTDPTASVTLRLLQQPREASAAVLQIINSPLITQKPRP